MPASGIRSAPGAGGARPVSETGGLSVRGKCSLKSGPVGTFRRRVQQVLVLNASYEPLNVCTVRRAHVLLYKGKAEVVEQLDQPLRSATASFVWPHVIRLVHYVRVPRAIQRKISRRALFARD